MTLRVKQTSDPTPCHMSELSHTNCVPYRQSHVRTVSYKLRALPHVTRPNCPIQTAYLTACHTSELSHTNCVPYRMLHVRTVSYKLRTLLQVTRPNCLIKIAYLTACHKSELSHTNCVPYRKSHVRTVPYKLCALPHVTRLNCLIQIVCLTACHTSELSHTVCVHYHMWHVWTKNQVGRSPRSVQTWSEQLFLHFQRNYNAAVPFMQQNINIGMWTLCFHYLCACAMLWEGSAVSYKTCEHSLNWKTIICKRNLWQLKIKSSMFVHYNMACENNMQITTF